MLGRTQLYINLLIGLVVTILHVFGFWVALKPPPEPFIVCRLRDLRIGFEETINLSNNDPFSLKAAQAQAASQRMRLAFFISQNHTDFVQYAINRPQEGGYFYALEAVKECQQKQPSQVRLDDLQLKQPNQQPTDEQLSDLRQRVRNNCNSMPTHLIKKVKKNAANKRLRATDPLLSVSDMRAAATVSLASR